MKFKHLETLDMSLARNWSLIFVALCPISSIAHHNNLGQYNQDNVGEISGIVTNLLWANPHIFVDVETATGTVWEIELQGPRQLTQLGLSQSDVEVGAQVTFAGALSVQNATGMSASHLLKPNCEEVLLTYRIEPRWNDCEIVETQAQSGQGDSSNPEAGIFRVWVLGPSGFHPINGRDPDSFPMNDAALAAYREFDALSAPTTDGCTTKGMPTILDNPLPYEFVERENSIELLFEEYDAVRVIHMDAGLPLAEAEPSPMGYSVGSWDGETLEVTTTAIDWPWLNQFGFPQSAESLIVERFTAIEDGARLQHVMTITDPVYLTEPLVMEHYRISNPNIALQSYNCQTKE